jgi:hypothetical protein
MRNRCASAARSGAELGDIPADHVDVGLAVLVELEVNLRRDNGDRVDDERVPADRSAIDQQLDLAQMEDVGRRESARVGDREAADRRTAAEQR